MSTKEQDIKNDNDNLTGTHSAITTQFQLKQQHFIILKF
jgi:hypothetical protein